MTSSKTSSNSTLDDVAADAKAATDDLTETVRSTAREAVGKASSEASNAAYQAQNSAADEVKSIASAMRTAADELRSGSPQERTFSQLADGLADASEAFRNKDMGEMMGDLNSFARANPTVFLGGAALLGFAATRFAKASSRGASGPGGTHARGDDRQAGPNYPQTSGVSQSAPAGVTATPSAAPSSAAFRAADARRPGSSTLADPEDRTFDQKGE